MNSSNLLGNNLILSASYQQKWSIVFHRQFRIVQVTIFPYSNVYNASQAGRHTWLGEVEHIIECGIQDLQDMQRENELDNQLFQIEGLPTTPLTSG